MYEWKLEKKIIWLNETLVKRDIVQACLNRVVFFVCFLFVILVIFNEYTVKMNQTYINRNSE